MSEYPKALYRKGSEFEWEGLKLDGLTVNNAEEEKAAVGWSTLDKLLEKPKAKK